ncbi:MAG: 3-deoxy-8-phosphooctulonate synthase [Candidatus Omnitrophica bacterium]|nr:3-deoxy-8-phosphooctulonate synthase [Candidatus Omnitrophota bacterium]
MNKITVKTGTVCIGNESPLVLIAGPCVIESAQSAECHAEEIKKITEKLNVPFIFKSSYDKANRSSVNSFRGPGIKRGLKILGTVRDKFNIPVLSDVHCVSEVEPAAEVLDIIQIPAFLCRQTDLIVKAAKTGKTVNVKKGQFMSPYEMKNVVEKIESAGNKNILLTERGTSFGYNTLVNDFRSLVMLEEMGYPVVYDATHSVQAPGGNGTSSGGDSKYVLPLSRAAVAVGCDALFVEVHMDPVSAMSDGANMLKLEDLEGFLIQIKKVREAI